MKGKEEMRIRDKLVERGFIDDRTPKVEVVKGKSYFIDKRKRRVQLDELFPVGSKIVVNDPEKKDRSFAGGHISRFEKYMPVFEYTNSNGVTTEWRLDYHYLYLIWFWLIETEIEMLR